MFRKEILVERIREYIVDRLLGRGGMGTVYLATHVHLKKKAALKVLLEQFSENIAMKNRFVNEASLLHGLQHKNIVQQREFFEENGRLVLVMEYVDGNPLDKMIGEEVGPVPWEKTLPLFTQILDGIGYAHSKNIIHRDIKPANILISKEGQVKVSDLGIAKIAGQQGMTRTGAQMGTLFYESPEQIKGAKDVDHRSDIYSLGMTLYEMLAGRLPFDTDEDTSEFALMNSVVNRAENLDPREYYPHIPEWLVKTIQKATDLDPNERFQSCKHFKQIIVKYGELSESENTFWSEKVASVVTSPTQPSELISAHSTPSSASTEEQCPKCNARVNETMEFCMKCGGNLQKICPNCSSSILWFADFCPKCGVNQKEILISQKAELVQKLTEERSRLEHHSIVEKMEQEYFDSSGKKEANGIIVDPNTYLEWQVGADSNTDWYEAESWIKSLGGNWRLPSRVELLALYRSGISFGNWRQFQNSGSYVWSSEVRDSYSAWYFDFEDGFEYYDSLNDSLGVRAFAVRSR